MRRGRTGGATHIEDASRSSKINKKSKLIKGKVHANLVYEKQSAESDKITANNDVGVVTLDEAVTDRPVAKLPYAGQRNGLQKGTVLSIVGYGRRLNVDKNVAVDVNARQSATITLVKPLTESVIPIALSGDQGVTCHSDSGGPVLWNVPGSGEIVAAIGSLSDCQTNEQAYRLDLAEARKYLTKFVALPEKPATP